MGTELLIGVVLGFIVLGRRRMQSMLGNLGRAKAHFDKATRELKSQLTAELEGSPSILNQKQSLSPHGLCGGSQRQRLVSPVSLLDSDPVLRVGRTDVLGAGADQTIVVELFDDMSCPSAYPRHRKDHR